MTRTYVRVKEVEDAPMRDESILYVPSSESYCHLNQSGGVLWEALAEPTDEDQLATLLVDRFEGTTIEEALSDVRAVLKEMQELSLVREVT